MHHGKFGMIKKRNLRILVTGHTGFKGLWLSSLLKMKGHYVYGLSNSKNFKPYKALKEKMFTEEFFFDVSDFGSLEEMIKKINPDFIFHLAAQPLVQNSYASPYETFKSNSHGTLNLLEVIRKYKKIPSIIVTTDKVYANDENGFAFSESDRIWGKDPYSASKAICEQLVECYRNCYDNCSEIYTARAGNVIGGGDYSENRLMPDIFRALHNNHCLHVRNPLATRPWQHVLEPIFGYYLYFCAILESRPHLPPALNFGPSEEDNLSVLEVVNVIKNNMPLKVTFEQTDMMNNTLSYSKEAQKLFLDSTLAANSIGWVGKLGIQSAILNTFYEYSMLEKCDCSYFIFKKAIEGYQNV